MPQPKNREKYKSLEQTNWQEHCFFSWDEIVLMEFRLVLASYIIGGMRILSDIRINKNEQFLIVLVHAYQVLPQDSS